jgi:hypothetical protein
VKVKFPARAKIHDNYIALKELNSAGKLLIDRLFKKKNEWEQRNNKEFFLQVELDLRHQKRTYKQNSTIWVLVTAIFESMEGRLPCEEEKYALYLDLLEEYADKIPSKLNGNLRPVHISEANSAEGARFIDSLIYHLATLCDLTYDTQATVIGVLQEWHDWRGGLEVDPLDYSDAACTKLLTESQWRDKHPVSEASGKGTDIVLHHIVTRGSNKAAEHKAWNWCALTDEEHRLLHQQGEDYFLRVYPHLKGRFSRAKHLASRIQGKKEVESLAMEALNVR